LGHAVDGIGQLGNGVERIGGASVSSQHDPMSRFQLSRVIYWKSYRSLQVFPKFPVPEIVKQPLIDLEKVV
jgi:hypothetical protein